MTSRDDRSLGELFGELSRETSELFRKEVALAKAELTQKANQVGVDIGFLAAGGAVAYAGFLALVAAVILLLGEAIPLWLSALIVGLLVGAAGGLLVRQGLQRLKTVSPAPEQTVETLKEDAEWLKNRAR